MKQFMGLREFLLLKDPTDQYGRSVFRGDFLPQNARNGSSSAMDCVDRYDIAKASWEQFGAEGPPIGTQVEMLEAGHGGSAGVIRTFGGVYDSDTRFFQVYREEMRYGKVEKQVSLVLRDTWFVSMRAA